MTFLEPVLLWGLPLAALPIIIHLFNRLRHRTMHWAAMMFLLAATRKSTRYAKLRQWLVLAMRVLALCALIFAISRPLAGGWVGWMLHPAPDAIVMVLDRSASMEARMPGGSTSKRQEAVRLLAEAAKGYEETSRLILFDSALRQPQEVGDAMSLPQLAATAPTDTAADMPALLQTVADWLSRNKPGQVEIWIASDLQSSSWHPDSTRWPAVAAQLAALPQTARIRLLALDQPAQTESAAIAVAEVNRRYRSDPPEVELVLDLERNNPTPSTRSLTFVSEGSRSTLDLQVQGQSFRYRHKITLDSPTAIGWGRVELQADNNPRDNVAYYVYGPPVPLKSAVVATDEIVGRILKLAAAPIPADTNRQAEIITPEQASQIPLSGYSLLLWAAPPPKDETAKKLRAFVEEGGSLLVWAAGENGSLFGLSLGDVETAEPEKFWKIGKWEEKEGPLAKTDEGLSLPLNELAIFRRQALRGEGTVLAGFEDNGPCLIQRALGRGRLLICASSPHPEWSNLREGLVLVPLVQRLISDGGRRFTQADLLECGATLPVEAGTTILPVEGGRDARLQAGVYRLGQRLIAVNRPAAEADLETLEPAKARTLFEPVKIQLFTEQKQGESKLQSELWRTFLFIMVAFLLVEAMLILPPKTEAERLKVKV